MRAETEAARRLLSKLGDPTQCLSPIQQRFLLEAWERAAEDPTPYSAREMLGFLIRADRDSTKEALLRRGLCEPHRAYATRTGDRHPIPGWYLTRMGELVALRLTIDRPGADQDYEIERHLSHQDAVEAELRRRWREWWGESEPIRTERSWLDLQPSREAAGESAVLAQLGLR